LRPESDAPDVSQSLKWFNRAHEMKLPRLNELIVERRKSRVIFLNLDRRYGATKAKFFIALGFSVEAWTILAHALREHGRAHDVVASRETGYGPRYVVEGELATPSDIQVLVPSVWQFEHGSIAPRLITAYPVRKR
jgi:hypothetical protein